MSETFDDSLPRNMKPSIPSLGRIAYKQEHNKFKRALYFFQEGRPREARDLILTILQEEKGLSCENISSYASSVSECGIQEKFMLVSLLHVLCNCQVSIQNEDVEDSVLDMKIPLDILDIAFEILNSMYSSIQNGREGSRKKKQYLCLYAAVLKTKGKLYSIMKKPKDALAMYQKSYQILQKELGESHIETAHCIINIGKVHFELDNVIESIHAFEVFLRVANERKSKDFSKIYDALVSLGTMYNQCNIPYIAQKYLHQAQEIAKTHFSNDYVKNSQVHFKLGEAYYNIGNLDKSIESYKVSLNFELDYSFHATKLYEMQRRLQEARKGPIVIRLIGMGYALIRKESYEEALNTLHSALRIVPNSDEETLKDTSSFQSSDLRVKIYSSLANVHKCRGDFNSAVENFQKALEILQTNNPDSCHALSANLWNEFGKLYLENKFYEEALECFTCARNILWKIIFQDKSMIVQYTEITSNIAKSHFYLGDFQKSILHYKITSSFIDANIGENVHQHMECEEEEFLFRRQLRTMISIATAYGRMEKHYLQLHYLKRAKTISMENDFAMTSSEVSLIDDVINDFYAKKMNFKVCETTQWDCAPAA
ncbi:hypothetical protein CTEN210_14510 [Chaetoceros tenuissimus]|uniref:Uncharacterized protein n=1 Tax=Chaetoceros tenuissimus TaxID=426638 RepID=A0AAD3D8M9_9STRA|nr:hypothetical protein CTEN210_14510 [Chaetoceros tenuissimus]